MQNLVIHVCNNPTEYRHHERVPSVRKAHVSHQAWKSKSSDLSIISHKSTGNLSSISQANDSSIEFKAN